MKRSLSLIFIALVAACASNSGTPSQTSAVTTATYRSDDSPSAVEPIPEAILHDAQRNKDVAMAIEYPTKGTPPFPIVIFSHGYGASKDSYVPLTEYWTSHGYVCIKPNHADAGALRAIMEQRRAELEKKREELRQQGANRQAVREAMMAGQGPDFSEGQWEKQTVADWQNRVRDIEFIIDSLDQLEAKYPELKGRLDHTKIGIAGHSYGAFTAMLAAGVRSFAQTPPIQFSDPRVKAVIAMSPQGVGSYGLTQESFTNLHLPVMFMTGSNDRSGQAREASWRHDPFAYSPAGDKYFVSIEGAGHLAFAGGQTDDEPMMMAGSRPYSGGYGQQTGSMQQQPRPQYAQPGSSRAIFDAIKMESLAFWDAYLKGEEKGRTYLADSGNARVTIEKK